MTLLPLGSRCARMGLHAQIPYFKSGMSGTRRRQVETGKRLLFASSDFGIVVPVFVGWAQLVHNAAAKTGAYRRGTRQVSSKASQAVEVALPILNEAADWIVSISEAGEGVQYGFVALRVQLVGHATALTAAVDICLIAARIGGAIQVGSDPHQLANRISPVRAICKGMEY